MTNGSISNWNLLHQTIELEDGRKLGYAEFGDNSGVPVLYFHGHPGSRLELKLHENIPKTYGVRLIAVDRPGIGLSDYKPNRILLDWPDDIVELGDKLGLEKFSVFGYSGGGPYAAVCAYKIPHRLKCCAIVSGVGTIEMSRKDMIPSSRIRGFIARTFPFLIRRVVKTKMNQLLDPIKGPDLVLKTFGEMAEIDRKYIENPRILEVFLEEIREAFKSGPDGVANDEKIYVHSWGFNLADISPELQVYVWHGELDKNDPVSMGREVCKLIPNCKGFFYPDEGHLSLVFEHLEGILEIIRKH